MKDATYYLKTGTLMTLLTIESALLTNVLLQYVASQNYFTPPIETLATVTTLLLVIAFTYTLTVGAWGKYEQFVVVPLPIALGMFLGTFLLNPTYAILVGIVSYAVISYDVLIATNINRMMLFFEPKTILRFSTRGILFAFALLAGVLVLISSSETNINISEKIAEFAQGQFNAMLQPSAGDTTTLQEGVGGRGFPLNPELFGALGGEDSSSIINGLTSFNLDLQSTIEREVDRIIAPYQQFIPPLIAIVVFVLVRFLGSIVHLIFNFTVPGVFWLAKKTGLFHVQHVDVKKEILTFSKNQDVTEKIIRAPQSS